MCTCRGCYLLFTPRRRRRRPLPRRARPLPRLPRLRLSPAQWDALQIPVSVAFFFLNSTLERVAAFYPSPAGATESLLPLDTWDDVVAANPALATLSPTSRRSSSAPTRGGDARRVLPRADRRLLRAGRRSCAGLARLRRRAARPTTRSTRSSTGVRRTGPARWIARERALVRGARRPGRAATPRRRRSCCGCAITERRRRAGARRRAPVPDPIEPQRRRYDAGRGGAPASSCSARRPQWGDSLRPFLWTHVAHDGHRLHRRHRGRPARRVHLRLRGRGGQVPPRARRRRDPARSCCSPARSFSAGTRGGLRGRAGGVARGGVVPPARARSGAT